MAAGSEIVLERVAVRLEAQTIVSDINLTVGSGEFVCLLGPSGCGKSTLLNVIGGFVQATGLVTVGGKPVSGPSPDHGVVFQSSEALFPWLTVRENVEYGARVRGVPAAERRTAAEHYLRLVGLTNAADKFPSQLSGGMRQRAQIARVLANEPSVILMDEPFGALDAQTREIMQREVHRIWKATGATILFITHDIAEAVILADRIVTMTAGPSAKIKNILTVDLPHPRDLTAVAAIAVQRQLRDDIGYEVSRALAAQGLVVGNAA